MLGMNQGAVPARDIPRNLSNPHPCCKPRILCVDDQEFNLMTLRTMLETKYQITPDEAQNGQVAIDMYQEGLNKDCKCVNRAYKLVLMDINMPVLDGYEASEEILRLAQIESNRIRAL